jgi:hypothetical protein
MPEPMQLVIPTAGEVSGHAAETSPARRGPPPVVIRLLPAGRHSPGTRFESGSGSGN